MRKQTRQENFLYVVLWASLFVAPVVSLYVRSMSDDDLSFDWEEIWMIWTKFAIFLGLFLIHNFLLAPLLVYKNMRVHYIAATFAIVAAFAVFQCSTRPEEPAGMRHHEPPPGLHHKPPHLDKRHTPPAIIGEHDIVAVVILILMFGANLGIKGFYKQYERQKEFDQLEKQNLQQQLEYLKYQLNPHFLMNTLNNIHTLIEIDQEKAQEAVIQLSKILRYVLYDSNKKWVFISQEIAFMENYVKLMRMRYSDRLRFTVNSPDDGNDVLIPPMVFISFVENAFKHGVSYREESFIEITGKRYQNKCGAERLLWSCRNSKHQRQEATAIPRQGGVGMTNVRQRLDLIFGDDYTLDIHETDTTFEVVLDIPLEQKKL